MTAYFVNIVASAGVTFLVIATPPQEGGSSQANIENLQQMQYQSGVTASAALDNATVRVHSVVEFVTLVDIQRLIKLGITRTMGGLSSILLVLFIGLSIANIVNFAIWLPAIPALIGLMATAGAYIERLERSS